MAVSITESKPVFEKRCDELLASLKTGFKATGVETFAQLAFSIGAPPSTPYTCRDDALATRCDCVLVCSVRSVWMTGSSFVEFAFSWFPRFIGLPVKGSLVPFGFSFTSCPLAQAFTLSAFQTGCF